MKKLPVLFSILAFSQFVSAQAVPKIYENELVVSPKNAVGGPATGQSFRPQSVPSFTEDDLRSISQAAGIYTPSVPPTVCRPGVSCKPSPAVPEQINIEDLGSLGEISRVLKVTATSQGAVQNVLTVINAGAKNEAEPNYWRNTTQQLTPQPLQSPINEPSYRDQWGFASRSTAFGGANFVAAWTKTLGAASVNVAVIDTGIVTTHPELRAALLPGADMIRNPTLSNDGDGRDSNATDSGDFVNLDIRNTAGRSGNSNCDLRSSSWHGTHVAGTIAASINSQFGVGGAPNVKVIPVRVLGSCGGNDKDIIEGIYWAMGFRVPGLPVNQNIAQVINLSLGGENRCSSAYRTVFAEAKRRNILVVVAAGNESRNTSNFTPAGCSDVIAVAAHDRSSLLASFSNFGANVAVSAPGVGILSSVDSGRTIPASPATSFLQGTSMAAPHVAAALALLKSSNINVTYDQTIQFIRQSSAPFLSGSVCSVGGSRQNQCGSGLLDADRLLTVAGVVGPVTSPPPPITPPNIPPELPRNTGDGGGGCTANPNGNGNDLSLLILLASGLLASVVRRRSFIKK